MKRVQFYNTDGIQVLFETPPEGIETVPVLMNVPQPAPFFIRVELYFRRVQEDDYFEPECSSRPVEYGLRPSLGFGW
jgi:hypothetical protein